MTINNFTRISCDQAGCLNSMEIPTSASAQQTGWRDTVQTLWGWKFEPTIVEELGPEEVILCAHHAKQGIPGRDS